jgi:hypothetical protein
MAVSEKTVSALVQTQLPDFVRADHPKFQRFVELYYQWLESNNPDGISNTAGNTIYHAMNIDSYRDIDNTPSEFIRYFKQEILPHFPERTALSTEKILKSAREFYSKKGSDESLRWLFKALFNEDIEILYPKEEILIASDGKWLKPKAFQITSSDTNKSVNVQLLKKRIVTGVDSGATCVVESADRTIDKTNGKEIIEIYVSNVKRYYNNGEKISIKYLDEQGEEREFLERIVGTISNIKIDSNIRTDPTQRRRGLYYNIGDPVVVTGGLGITSDANDAVAIVGNVTLGSIESVTTKFPGYGYRLYSNTEVIVYRNTGDDPRANMFTDLQVSVLNETACTANSEKNFSESITYDRSVIEFSADTLISSANYAVFTQNNRNVILNVTETDKDDGYDNAEQVWANGTNFLDARFSGKIATRNNAIFGVGGPTNNTGALVIYDVKLQGVETIEIALTGAQLQTKNTDKVFTFNSVVNAQVPANQDSQLVQCFDFVTENTGGIALISVINGGAGFRQSPPLGIESHYDTQLSSLYDYQDDEDRPFKKTHWQTFKDLGLIAHIRIVDGGRGYAINDTISFAGRGYGGAAKVKSVGAGGRITSIEITDRGEGYYARPELHVTRVSPTYTSLTGTVNVVTGSSIVVGTGTAFTGVSGANTRNLIRVNSEIRRVISVVNNTHLIVNSAFKKTGTANTIEKQSGAEPVLIGYLFGDGVENIVNTSAIGRIKDLRLIYRGYDYVSTPNVSLKVLDTVINPIPEANVLYETEYAYQGNSILDSTFKANIKSYNSTTGVLRLYNYSGTFSNTQDLITANGVYCNSNLSMNVPAPSQYPSQVIADGLPNPMRYGNGLAKARAFFANGLIEFNGFYLNTDGFVSADKVLQDGKIYHNFAYVVESEKNLVDYESTIKNIAHPAGMSLISKTLSRNDIERTVEYSSNVTTILSRNRTEGGAAATVTVANSRSNVVTGSATTFLPDANGVALYANTRVNVGDLIIIDDDPDDIVVPEVLRLPISKVISKINSNTELEVYGDFIYRGQGLVSSNNQFLRILGTSNTSGNQVTANADSRYDGTYFQNNNPNPDAPIVSVNNIIRINGEVREVISVTNATHFVVNSNFTSNVTLKPLEILSNTRLVVTGNANILSEIVKAGDNVSLNIFTANVYTAQTGTVTIFDTNATVIGSGTSFNTQLIVNDYIMVANQTRQVINISNATVITVDSPYTSNANSMIYLKKATVQNARVNAVVSNYIDINLWQYGNTTNAVYHVIPNLTSAQRFKIVTLTGN